MLRSRSRLARRGFTMVELLAVVAMVGILATLAIAGYRQYSAAANVANVKDTIGSIRISQESWRAETLSYLSCSASLTDWYPAAPNGKKRGWYASSNAGIDCWRMLNVTQDSPTKYGFAVVAGGPGGTPPQPNLTGGVTWPTPTEPWFVVQAAGDDDGDSTFSFFVSSSFSGEVIAENENE